MSQSMADIPPTAAEKRAARALAMLDFLGSCGLSDEYKKNYKSASSYADEWWEERYVPLVRYIIADRPEIPERFLG